MAVDWISEKLVDRGVPVLRIGNPTRVNDKMLAFTYEDVYKRQVLCCQIIIYYFFNRQYFDLLSVFNFRIFATNFKRKFYDTR